MRQIETQEQSERRRKRNARMMSIFMLGVLFIGTLGYAFSYYGDGKSDEQVEELDEEVRGVYINSELIILQYPLEETRNISTEFFRKLYDYSGKPLYVDSDNGAVFQELAKTVGRFSPKFQQACYGECEEDLPEKDCKSNMIIFEDSDESRIFGKENCIFISGDLKAVDAFIYKIFGIN